jgi:hypothetical protein
MSGLDEKEVYNFQGHLYVDSLFSFSLARAFMSMGRVGYNFDIDQNDAHSWPNIHRTTLHVKDNPPSSAFSMQITVCFSPVTD